MGGEGGDGSDEGRGGSCASGGDSGGDGGCGGDSGSGRVVVLEEDVVAVVAVVELNVELEVVSFFLK